MCDLLVPEHLFKKKKHRQTSRQQQKNEKWNLRGQSLKHRQFQSALCGRAGSSLLPRIPLSAAPQTYIHIQHHILATSVFYLGTQRTSIASPKFFQNTNTVEYKWKRWEAERLDWLSSLYVWDAALPERLSLFTKSHGNRHAQPCSLMKIFPFLDSSLAVHARNLVSRKSMRWNMSVR